MSELATYDTGWWKEVARLEVGSPDQLAVFQTDPGGVIRYGIFQRAPSGYWYSEHQSGPFESLEEAVADSVRWRV
ncbi:MAG TPA: hypothetical protein VG939_15445 [Caulobacteraceae bacterium]|nr:hypothetical protein [Caulobacteraceae bacterium]